MKTNNKVTIDVQGEEDKVDLFIKSIEALPPAEKEEFLKFIKENSAYEIKVISL